MPPEDVAVMQTGPIELTVKEMLDRREKVKQVMEKVMEEGVHYGVLRDADNRPVIDKPSLWKPGAEVLCSVFMLDPQPEIVGGVVQPDADGHLTVTIRTTLYHIPTGKRVATGLGLCTTREKKYAQRYAKKKCPACGAEQVNRSKFPPKSGGEPGWYCYQKVGGCGAQFAADDPEIVNQDVGVVANENLPDSFNTVLKMADKRSHVAVVLKALGVSDLFTQDVEDLEQDEVGRGASNGKAAPQGARAAETKKPPRQAAARPAPAADPGDPFGTPEEAAGRPAPEKPGNGGQEADPRPTLARRVVALRSGFKTQPSAQSWAAIVSYFATGAYLKGQEDRHTTAALAGVMKDDGQLQTMQAEHLEALAAFMRDLSSGEAKTVEHLKSVILKPRG